MLREYLCRAGLRRADPAEDDRHARDARFLIVRLSVAAAGQRRQQHSFTALAHCTPSPRSPRLSFLRKPESSSLLMISAPRGSAMWSQRARGAGFQLALE